MSEAKFTKGDWVVLDNGYFLDIHVVDDKGNYLDQICMGVTYDNKGNAPLIAAAPEMYADIEDDIKELSHELNNKNLTPHTRAHLTNKLNAKTKLLAKARGES